MRSFGRELVLSVSVSGLAVSHAKAAELGEPEAPKAEELGEPEALEEYEATAEVEAPPAQVVERGDLFRQSDGVPQRQQQDGRPDAESTRTRGNGCRYQEGG